MNLWTFLDRHPELVVMVTAALILMVCAIGGSCGNREHAETSGCQAVIKIESKDAGP